MFFFALNKLANYLIFIPIDFPAWIMGILFIVVSIFGIKSQIGHIGHEAHLGGALTGILGTLIINPEVAISNWWIIFLPMASNINSLRKPYLFVA